MTILHPCLHCHRREGCDVRAAKARAIRGAGLTVARFRCDLAQADFPAGCRVEALMAFYGYDEDLRRTNRTIAGTVMRWNRGRAVVLFDEPITLAKNLDGPGARIIMMPSRRLKALDEPRRELCACDFPKAPDGSCALPEGLDCRNPPADLDAAETLSLAELQAMGTA